MRKTDWRVKKLRAILDDQAVVNQFIARECFACPGKQRTPPPLNRTDGWVGMARFIAIERATGRVYGDTARFGEAGNVASPDDAVLLFDRRCGRAPRGFGHVGPTSMAASYDVYEIHSSGSPHPTANEAEAQALVHDHGSWAVALVSYNS